MDKEEPRKFLGERATITPHYLVTPQMAHDWHAAKDSKGPTFAGSPSWINFLTILETKLKEYGAVDFVRNSWTYDRYHTSEWPNNENWTLVSDGDPVRVANYGSYSGSTGDQGISAELAYYDHWNPPESIEGKIVVFSTTNSDDPFEQSDYEYLSDPETFPDSDVELPVTGVGPTRITSISSSVNMYCQMRQLWKYLVHILREGNAAGAIVIYDTSYDRLAGIHTFPVPDPYDAPTLFLDRIAGRKVIEDAMKSKMATLKLVAKVESTEVYQLICYLPGRNYGTPEDEMIILTSHTDGPSLTQENGAFGLLGIIYYFSHIPQSDRSRTLMIFLDNRHYMPGMEHAFSKQDWFARNPNAMDHVVAFITMEHLGEAEYREVGNLYEPTGRVEPTALWVTSNQVLIDKAIQAVKDSQWPRAMVTCVSRPGTHGKKQGMYYGLGFRWVLTGLPGYACLAGLSAYWSTRARINLFDSNQFCKQVAGMTQLTSDLMVANLDAIVSPDISELDDIAKWSLLTGWPEWFKPS